MITSLVYPGKIFLVQSVHDRCEDKKDILRVFRSNKKCPDKRQETKVGSDPGVSGLRFLFPDVCICLKTNSLY